jgi:biotin operon repressor
MAAKKETEATTEMSKEEQIGFHKGSLSTLAKERQELGRILGIVEQLMQMHVAALKQLGVDLETIAKEAQDAPKETAKKPKKPIEDMF